MTTPLTVAFDLIVLAKVRVFNAPIGAGRIALLLRRDGFHCHPYDVREALRRLDYFGRVQPRTEFGDMVPRWTARERFAN